MVTGVVTTPEDAALEARRKLGVGETARLDDILRLIEEQAEVPVVLLPIPGDEPDGFYTRVRRRPFIMANSMPYPVRQRFTLAHELGHHWLGHGETWDQKITQKDSRPKEKQANKFASEFLVPRAALEWWFAAYGDPEVDLDVLVRLAHHFDVSCQMMRYRLENTHCLSNRKRIKELDEAIESGAHRQIHLRLGLASPTDAVELSWKKQRVPDKMKANLLWAVSQDLMSPKNAAKRLRLTEARLRDELVREEIGT